MADKKLKDTINAQGIEISIVSDGTNDDYISLTDIAKYKNSDDPRFVIQNWMRNRNTIEFLGTWESLYNPNFNRVQFEAVKSEAGLNRFVMTPAKWIKDLNGIGIISKAGRYGGTLAHKDIAFEFASWISAEFKLYIIKDYQRLKNDESYRLSLDWNLKREISKINYKIHTDAIKDHIIPNIITKQQERFAYANEADLLNVALFGMTAKEWRTSHPDLKGNIRDNATILQLIVLSNLENLNAQYIKQGLPSDKRLLMLNEIAIQQMISLVDNSSIKKLEQQSNEQ